MNTEPLARAAALHPWRTIIVWIVAVVAAFAAVGGTGVFDKLSTDAHLTNNPESQQAYDLIGRHYRGTDFTTEVVVVRNDALARDDPAFQAQLRQLTRAARATGAVADAGEPQVVAGRPRRPHPDPAHAARGRQRRAAHRRSSPRRTASRASRWR